MSLSVGIAGLLVAATAGGSAVGASPHVRTDRPLHAGKAVSLGLSSNDVLAIAEAPNGAVFYAPHPVIGAMGGIKHAAAAKVIRVIDGTKPAAVAEHAPNPVLALAANTGSLFVVTTKQTLKYSRSTGALEHSWSLPATSSYATATLTSQWLYVDSAFECDACGYEPTTLTAINLRSYATHAVGTKVTPGSVAARGGNVYYGLNTTSGHIVRTTPTAKKNHYTRRSPKVGLATIGFFGGKILTWGSAPNGTDSDLYLVNPSTMDVFFRSIPSAGAFDIVEAPTPIYSNSTCPQQIPASKCHSATFGELGNQISRQSLTSGRLPDRPQAGRDHHQGRRLPTRPHSVAPPSNLADRVGDRDR
jgi:hypothetical protein